MDTYNQFVFESSTVEEQTESSALLETWNGTSGIKRAAAKSDEEEEGVILASNTPKKRTGRRVFKETRHPIYRGVRGRNKNKWVCELREPNKKTRIWLGTYPTPEMAARAHDVAALAFRGKMACLNFADSVWLLPTPSSSNSKDIIKTAIEAAESFRPPEFGGNFDGIDDKVLANKDDDDDQLDINVWLSKMAQGPMFSPPHYSTSYMDWDSHETEIDCSLWTFSS